jgi:curved DNA-binding protein CbpA
MAGDPYVVLGVSKSAGPEEIRRAYRRHALRLHPDRNPSDKDAERKFKEISAAYDVLSDTVKRAAYDRGERTPAAGPSARPQVVVPPFRSGARARRAAPGAPTFQTGPMELGKTYTIRPGGVRLGPVPFRGEWNGEIPAVPVFIPKRKRS